MLREWLIEILGGYPDIDAAIEAIREHPDRHERREILTMAVKRLFTTIGPEDLLREAPGGGWLYKGKPVPRDEIKELQEEARAFAGSKIWNVIQQDLAYHSVMKVFKEAKDVHDITAGKLLAYYADVVNTRLKRMTAE